MRLDPDLNAIMKSKTHPTPIDRYNLRSVAPQHSNRNAGTQPHFFDAMAADFIAIELDNLSRLIES